MAAGKLAAPGTEYGPCEEACVHDDCAMTRVDARCVCRFCETPIGYDRGFYKDPTDPSRLVHSTCLEDDTLDRLK